jgi:hypothetical protein
MVFVSTLAAMGTEPCVIRRSSMKVAATLPALRPLPRSQNRPSNLGGALLGIERPPAFGGDAQPHHIYLALTYAHAISELVYQLIPHETGQELKREPMRHQGCLGTPFRRGY